MRCKPDNDTEQGATREQVGVHEGDPEVNEPTLNTVDYNRQGNCAQATGHGSARLHSGPHIILKDSGTQGRCTATDLRVTHKSPVDLASSATSFGDSPNNKRLSTATVASGEDALLLQPQSQVRLQNCQALQSTGTRELRPRTEVANLPYSALKLERGSFSSFSWSPMSCCGPRKPIATLCGDRQSQQQGVVC
jgi:hypothetical protein